MDVAKFQLRREDAVLVVVDIQERLAAAMAERGRVEENAVRLVRLARLLGVPVLVTEQYPRGLGPTVAPLREHLGGLAPIEKLTFDCCGEPAFLAAVGATGRGTALLAGMEAHVCVLQTALGLLGQGAAVHVVADAVCSRDAANAATGLALVRDAGAVVTCTETAVFQLLGRAGTEEFKAALPLVK
jgi:nicotinamidase-related amidase